MEGGGHEGAGIASVRMRVRLLEPPGGLRGGQPCEFTGVGELVQVVRALGRYLGSKNQRTCSEGLQMWMLLLRK